MVHRVYPLFLPFCKLYGFIYIVPVFSRCAALLIIGKAVCVLCTFGGSFIDRIIRGGRCSLFRLCFFFLYCGCFFGKLRRVCFCFGLFGGFLRGLRLFGGLLLILCLLDFCKMPVYGINQLCGGAADCFKRAFQFYKFFSATPPGDIPKRIVRRIKPVMLADSIGAARTGSSQTARSRSSRDGASRRNSPGTGKRSTAGTGCTRRPLLHYQ